MATFRRSIIATLCTLITIKTIANAVVYNVALSKNAGGTATATSSTPFAVGFDASLANDGVVAFYNDAINCPGPYSGKMFKSKTALSSTDVWL